MSLPTEPTIADLYWEMKPQLDQIEGRLQSIEDRQVYLRKGAEAEARAAGNLSIAIFLVIGLMWAGMPFQLWYLWAASGCSAAYFLLKWLDKKPWRREPEKYALPRAD